MEKAGRTHPKDEICKKTTVFGGSSCEGCAVKGRFRNTHEKVITKGRGWSGGVHGLPGTDLPQISARLGLSLRGSAPLPWLQL